MLLAICGVYARQGEDLKIRQARASSHLNVRVLRSSSLSPCSGMSASAKIYNKQSWREQVYVLALGEAIAIRRVLTRVMNKIWSRKCSDKYCRLTAYGQALHYCLQERKEVSKNTPFVLPTLLNPILQQCRPRFAIQGCR